MNTKPPPAPTIDTRIAVMCESAGLSPFQKDRIKGHLRMLMEENERYEAVLREIAKPALGGKTQQYMAQQALSPTRS